MSAEPAPVRADVYRAMAYRRMCAAEGSAPDARARLAAAMIYLRDVVASAPAEVLAAVERSVRASVMDAVATVTDVTELAACGHPAAAWCGDPACCAWHWHDPDDPARVIPLEHRHCPDCQGTERAGTWAL